MPRKPPRRTTGTGANRRFFITAGVTALVGFGLGVQHVQTDAYTTASTDRSSTVDVAEDTAAVLGLQVASEVTTNQRDALVEITNNTAQSMSLTVALVDATQGTLTGPNGSGDSVSLTLPADATEAIDITAAAQDDAAIPFTIAQDSPTRSFTVGRETTAHEPAQSRPPAAQVYDIRREPHLDPGEFIFQITSDQVQNPSWDFGDGESASGHYTTHQYDSDDIYSVTVAVTIDGTQYTYTESLEVDSAPRRDGPPADQVYDIRQESWLGPREYIFQITSDQVQNPSWEFGDDTSQSGYWVTHSYATDGTYEVTLLVTINGTQYLYTENLTVSG